MATDRMFTQDGYRPDTSGFSPLPISPNELCERYERLFTAAVNDVLRDKGLLHQTLPYTITPMRDDMVVAGFAFTLKGAPSPVVEDEMPIRASMLEAITENSVCVWDTSNDSHTAQWGEVMTMAAKRQGCRGVVVDGGVRDTRKVLAQDFPVFCRYRTSNAMLGRFRLTAWQTTIRIGDVTIQPNDVIFADIDGVLVVPHHLAYDVLTAVEDVKRNEVEIKKMIVAGASPHDIVARGGYF